SCLSLLLLPPSGPPRSTLFPYSTLFRSPLRIRSKYFSRRLPLQSYIAHRRRSRRSDPLFRDLRQLPIAPASLLVQCLRRCFLSWFLQCGQCVLPVLA